MESEIETQISLKKTILRAELRVLTLIMRKQFEVVPKIRKFETMGKRHCSQWQKKKVRDKQKYGVKVTCIF